MKGGGHGFNNIENFKNTIRPILFYPNEPIVTTMIDYYGINSDKKMPNYSECINKSNINNRISCLEKKLFDIVQGIKTYPLFIPNLVLHEFETYLFANPKDGFCLFDDNIAKDVAIISESYKNIEEINNTPEGTPSKRLEYIFNKYNSKYSKALQAVDIAELSGIENIINKCEKLNKWLKKIEEKMQM